MAVNLSPIGGVAGQFFDNNGNPLSGGKIFTYAAGTTTNQATYTSATGVTAHTNPIILDAAGRVPGGEIWLTDGLSYKFVIKTSTDVLIGTYDNIIGINSNFINFLTETEIQTATAGQTVFTLTTMQYQPNTNSLSVFVDGVNQYDGVSYAYVETSSTVVTFTAGLHVGALVKFTTAQTLSSGVTDASLVTYDPPFANSVPTNVENKLAESVSENDFGGNAADAIAAAVANTVYLTGNVDPIVITVGSGGDFATINEAIEQATRMRPLYKTNSLLVEISLLTGFIMQEQVIADGIDLSFIKLTSVDAEVTISRESLTLQVYGIDYPAFSAINNGATPLIDCLFSMDATGSRINRSGMFAVNGGRAVFNFRSGLAVGIKNAGSRGIHAQHGSVVVARGCDFSSALEIGVRCASGSIVAMRDSKVTDCGANPAPGEGSAGCAVGGGILYAQGCDFSDSFDSGASCISGSINLLEATINNSVGRGINIRRGSTAELQEVECTNSGEYGLFVEGSFANAASIDLSNSAIIGINAVNGAVVNASAAIVDDCGGNAVEVASASMVNLAQASVQNAVGAGVVAIDGANVNCRQTNATGAGTFGFECLRGSTINASNATGTLSKTANTLTNDGVIYQ